MTRAEFLTALAAALALGTGTAATADVAPDGPEETMGLFLRLTPQGGVVTRSPPPQSAAARAGVRVGDVILSLNGQDLHNLPQRQFSRLGSGFSYDALLRVRRGRQLLQIQIHR